MKRRFMRAVACGLATVIVSSSFAIPQDAYAMERLVVQSVADGVEKAEESVLEFQYDESAMTAIVLGFKSEDTFVADLIVPEKVIKDGKEYSVMAIGEEAFYRSNLVSVQIPGSVIAIGKRAFAICKSLETVSLEYGLCRIFEYAFQYCEALTGIIIPDSVTNIEAGAFGSCCELVEVKLPNNLTYISAGLFSGCSKLKSISIPETVTDIYVGAFYYCSSLAEVVIPNSVTNIGDEIFWGCRELRRVTLSTQLVNIPARAFKDCYSLEGIEIPSNIRTIGERAFENCYEAVINVPDILIGDNAFLNVPGIMYSGNASGCPWGALSCNGYLEGNFLYSDSGKTKLVRYMGEGESQVTIPDLVKSIGDYGFWGCDDLVSVDIPEGLDSIGQKAFFSCKALINLEIPSSVQSIGKDAFFGVCGVQYEGNAEGAPWEARYYNQYICEGLVYSDKTLKVLSGHYGDLSGVVEIREGVEVIDDYAFNYCSEITDVIIPSSVTTIGACAFYCCDGITDLKVPESVTAVGQFAFFNVRNISYSGVADISGAGELAYNGYVDGYMVYADSGKTTLLGCSTKAAGDIVIPDGVVSIGELAFHSCEDITSVKLPDSMTDIGVYAFGYCSNLTRVKIPNGIERINENAFAHCSSLSDVIVSEDVVSVGNNAFDYVKRIFYSGSLDTSTWSSNELEIVTELPELIASGGVLTINLDRNGLTAGHVVDTFLPEDIQYRWTVLNKNTNTTEVIQDWTDNNEWLNWTPSTFGEYVITADARLKDDPEELVTAQTEAFEYNPYIKGKCQMPYWGEGGGYLIGVESYENPNQGYQYEMLILDCTLLAEGKPAWVYTTNKFTVTEGAAGWCVWQPEYGYYWTLFRVYDADGNMIDQACYPFVNAY